MYKKLVSAEKKYINTILEILNSIKIILFEASTNKYSVGHLIFLQKSSLSPLKIYKNVFDL